MIAKTYNGLKFLKEVYPISILVLLFFPTLFGLVIDHTLFDSRFILIDFLWLSLLLIPQLFLQKRYWIHFISTLLFIIGLITISHWIILRGPLTVTSFLVLANTNYNEAMEFMDLRGSIEFIILVPFAYVYYKSFGRTLQKEKVHKRIAIVCAVVALIFISENAINGRLIRKGSPHIAKVGFSFYERINLYKEAAQDVKPKQVDAVSSVKVDKQTQVVIIGESCSRRHMSLYGYHRNTTPRLASRSDLFVFDNVVAPYSNTLEAVLSILSQSNLEVTNHPKDEIDLIDVYHSAGYKSFWISNQSPIGVWDNQVTVLANQADVVRFVNLASNSSYEATYTTSYDEKVLAPFNEALADTASKKLIFVHLMGSHTSYRKRYPSSFALYDDETTKKDEIISEYDNSVLYNDFVVDSLFSSVAQLESETYTTAVYLSDHGENVYDHGDKAGHDYNKDLPQVNVEIPFVLWGSLLFFENNPEFRDRFVSRKNTPFISDDLFHTLIDFAGIASPVMDSTRSFIHASFDSTRVRILEDGMDYDLK